MTATLRQPVNYSVSVTFFARYNRQYRSCFQVSADRRGVLEAPKLGKFVGGRVLPGVLGVNRIRLLFLIALTRAIIFLIAR